MNQAAAVTQPTTKDRMTAAWAAFGSQDGDRIVRFLTREFGTVFVADVAFDITGIFADGDVVITEARLTGTLAHGGRYENDYCFIAELKDGLIHRVREYMDTRRGAAWFAASPT
jgi:hypothetical protein